MAMNNRLAHEVMTENPACCTPETPLDQVAMLMREHNCGEIPVIDLAEQPIGVVTDRDIVCRVVAEGKNPMAYPAALCMSQPVATVPMDAPLGEVIITMEQHQVRRVPVVDEDGRCVGMISQADVAWTTGKRDLAELVREISRDTGGTTS
jgi:CBS domain-containing protein